MNTSPDVRHLIFFGGQYIEKSRCDLFVKGPIPLPWIKCLLGLSPSANKLSWVLWFYHGLNKGGCFTLSNTKLEQFGIDRKTKRKGLNELENSGLILVQRFSNRSPIVQVLPKTVE